MPDSQRVTGRPQILVTSALEETWPAQGEQAVFLGDWCLRYSRRDVWDKMDFVVLPYHWDQRDRLPRDLEYLSDVYERLLPQLASQLNSLHGTNYSLRYWRIVTGWWLFYFAQIVFDRWEVLQCASDRFPRARILRMPTDTRPPALNDMAAFLTEATSDAWNERLFADIAERGTNLEVREALSQGGGRVRRSSGWEGRDKSTSWKRRLLLRAHRPINRLARKWTLAQGGVALHADYLPFRERAKLLLSLGQLPTLQVQVPTPFVEASWNWRAWKLNSPNDDPYMHVLCSLLPEHLPVCYLEGYEESELASRDLLSCKHPKVVMTANAFESDDLWKLQAARAVEDGAKLVIAQHGGHYGAGAWSASLQHEVAISDRYLTWGWDLAGESRVVPAPATKLIGSKKISRRKARRCIQVLCALPQQSYWMYSVPVGPQFKPYLQDQFQFITSLSDDVRRELIVRLPRRDYGWDITPQLKNLDPTMRLDSGSTSFRRLLHDARLVVATYNATVFLESMTHGVPTVMFWNPESWELSSTAQPYFDMLREADVLFDTPDACANHVNAVWENVSEWWSTGTVQSAVRTFRHRYAYVGAKPTGELKSALTDW